MQIWALVAFTLAVWPKPTETVPSRHSDSVSELPRARCSSKTPEPEIEASAGLQEEATGQEFAAAWL